MATRKPPRPPFVPPRAAVTRAAAEAVRKPPAPTRPLSAAELVKKAERLRAQVDQSSYELGLTLRELQRRYAELDYKSFEELLKARELMSRQTAHKLIAIVNAFDRKAALSLGTEKAYQVIRYAREEHANVAPAQVVALDPAVPVPVDRKTVHIPLSTLSARALAAAVSALQQRAARKATPVNRFKTTNRRLAQLLRHAGVTAERVSTRHRRHKPSVIRIELTIEEAEDLVAFIKSRPRR